MTAIDNPDTRRMAEIAQAIANLARDNARMRRDPTGWWRDLGRLAEECANIVRRLKAELERQEHLSS